MRPILGMGPGGMMNEVLVSQLVKLEASGKV